MGRVKRYPERRIGDDAVGFAAGDGERTKQGVWIRALAQQGRCASSFHQRHTANSRRLRGREQL